MREGVRGFWCSDEGVDGDCGVNGVDIEGHNDMTDMIEANDVRG